MSTNCESNCKSQIIKLNIGGYKFCSTIATLTKIPNTYFTGLLSEKFPSTLDEEGAYFIDRDGQFFAPILTWLRTNEISFPPSLITKEDIIREARFYALDPLVEELLREDMNSEAEVSPKNSFQCPSEIATHVLQYFQRQENSIFEILSQLNKQGTFKICVQIIPGHRQDFERPPQILDNGRLGLHINFTMLHIKTYAHVQGVLASCFKKKGLSGYFRPGELIELWWGPSDLQRENDIIYF